jgi:glycerophosphoryl diester phosphodiesterase
MAHAKPLIIAGATGYGVWPANTLEGAEQCLAAPIDGIEIDVQLTADGHVVAHHDYRINADQSRLEGAWLEAVGPALKTLSLDDLRRYDVGRAKPGSRTARHYPGQAQMDGVRVPTLRELLDLLRAAPGPRRLLYVEIKTDPRDGADAPAPDVVTSAVFDDLEAADYLDHAKIIAFDWQVLRLSRARQHGVRTAHLTIPQAMAAQVKRRPDGRSPWTDGCDPLDHGGSELAAIKAHGGMEWSPHLSDMTPERVAEAERLGLLVGPWGISTAADIAAARGMGAFSLTVSGPEWGQT